MERQSFSSGLSYYAGAFLNLWQHPVGLEQAPDLIAWSVCGSLAIWTIRSIFVRRPKYCIGVSLSWLCWFALQVLQNGTEAWSGLKTRGVVALEATEQLFLHGVLFCKAWVDFFLPFMNSLGRWAVHVWKSLTQEERLLLLGLVFGVYAVVKVIRLARSCLRSTQKRLQGYVSATTTRLAKRFGQTKSRILKVFIDILIFATLPFLWIACSPARDTSSTSIFSYLPAGGYVAPEHLPTLTMLVITHMPALLSMHTISCKPQEEETPRDGDRRNLVRHRGWLSYWVCWPLLALLSSSPRVFGHAEEINKVLVIFAICLMRLEVFGYVSALFHRLAQTSLFGVCFRFFGRCSFDLFGIVRNHTTFEGGRRMMKMFSMFSAITRFGKKIGLVAVVIAGLCALFVLLKTLTAFYHTLSFLMWMVTKSIYLLIASKTANTLEHKKEGDYTQMLSFWVMACVWEVFTMLCDMVPAIGGAPRLLTPFTHTLWLLQGEWVVRQVVIPLTHKPLAILSTIKIRCCRKEVDQTRAASDATTRQPTLTVPEDSPRRQVSSAGGTGDATRRQPVLIPPLFVTTPNNGTNEVVEFSPAGDTGSEPRLDDVCLDDTGDTGGEPPRVRSRTASRVSTSSDTGGTQQGTVSNNSVAKEAQNFDEGTVSNNSVAKEAQNFDEGAKSNQPQSARRRKVGKR